MDAYDSMVYECTLSVTNSICVISFGTLHRHIHEISIDLAVCLPGNSTPL